MSASLPEARSDEAYWKMARESSEKALRVDPRFSDASLRLGCVLWRMGRSSDARQALETATIEGKGLTRHMAHLFLGQVLEDARDLRGAVAQYSAAVALEPRTQIGALALAHGPTLQSDPPTETGPCLAW